MARHELHRSTYGRVRHIPEVEPADHLAQAERTKLFKSANDGGDAAEAFIAGHRASRAVGECWERNDRLTALVDVLSHLAMPTQRLLHLAQCLLVGIRDTDAPKHVHLADFTA